VFGTDEKYSYWLCRLIVPEADNPSHTAKLGIQKGVRGEEITKIPFIYARRRLNKRSLPTIISYKWMRYAYSPYN
jgi:hypothetical protein